MTSRWHLSPRARLEPAGPDGPGVVIDTYNAGMFMCNEVAWALLEWLQSGAEVVDLATRVSERFGIAEAAASRDVQVFLHQLKRMGLADDRP